MLGWLTKKAHCPLASSPPPSLLTRRKPSVNGRRMGGRGRRRRRKKTCLKAVSCFSSSSFFSDKQCQGPLKGKKRGGGRISKATELFKDFFQDCFFCKSKVITMHTFKNGYCRCRRHQDATEKALKVKGSKNLIHESLFFIFFFRFLFLILCLLCLRKKKSMQSLTPRQKPQKESPRKMPESPPRSEINSLQE